MFTRHLYECDEVIAALHWCIKRGRLKEAVFWCLELLDSEMIETLQRELLSVWLWYFSLGCLAALPELFGDTREELLLTVCKLTRLPTERRDRSVLGLCILGLETQQPDRNSHFDCLEPLFQLHNCSELEKAFLSSVYQGKTQLAFGLSRPLWQEKPTRVYTLLQEVQTLKHKSSLGETLTLLELYGVETWPTRACAVAAVCLDSKRLNKSLQPLQFSIPHEVEECIREWTRCVGRRQRRAFEIPIEAIYKRTARGCLSNRETTLEKLYSLNIENLEGSPFWNRVIEEEAPWLEDDRKEEFYDLYFPDDIPDEWSRKDQEKSHGYGCLINKEIPNEGKYRDRWFRDTESRACWIQNSLLQKRCDIESWDKAYEQAWLEHVSTWCLTPVKKRVFVVETGV